MQPNILYKFIRRGCVSDRESRVAVSLPIPERFADSLCQSLAQTPTVVTAFVITFHLTATQ